MPSIIHPRRRASFPLDGVPTADPRIVSLLTPNGVGLFEHAQNKPSLVSGFGSALGSGSGRFGAAITASGGGLIVNNTAAYSTTAFTVTLVAQIDAIDNPWGGIFAVSNANADGRFSLQRDGANNSFVVYHSNTPLAITGIVPSDLSGRQHIVTVSSPGDASSPVRVYLDGKLVFSGTHSGSVLAPVSPRLVLLGERSASATYGSDGKLSLFALHNTQLSTEEIFRIHANPSTLFASNKQFMFDAMVAAGSATGDLLVSQNNNTSLSSSLVLVSSNSSVLQSNNNSVATAIVPITGSATVTQVGNTTTSFSTVALTAASTVTQSSNTSVATATLPIVGDVSKAQVGNTSSSTAILPIVATSTATQAGNTSVATSVVAIVATEATSQSSNTLTSSAAVALISTLSKAQAGNTSAAAGVVSLTAAASIQQAGNTVISTATQVEQRVCDLIVSQSGNTVVSSAVVAISGTSTRTQAGNTLVSSAVVAINGVYTQTQAGNTLVSSAVGAISANGTLIQTGDSVFSNSNVLTVASINIAQNDNTLSAFAGRDIIASALISQLGNTLTSNAINISFISPDFLFTDIIWVDPDATPTIILRDLN